MAVTLNLVWQDKALGQGLFQKDGLLCLTRGEQMPQTLTLEQSWTKESSYIFVPLDFKGDASFAQKLLCLLTRPPKRSFLWVANPEAEITDWKRNTILCNKTQEGSFAVRPAGIGTCGCEVFIAADTLIDCNGERFGVSPAAGNGYPLSLRVGRMVMEQDTAGAAILADGTVGFSATANPGNCELFERMGVSMQYAGKWHGGSPHENALGGGLYKITAKPLVYSGALSFKCRVNITKSDDPVQLQLPEGVTLESAFSTTAGMPLKLVTTDNSALTLCSAPHHLFSDGHSATARQYAYLCPRGRFTLRSDKSDGDIRLLCGLAGTEYLEIDGNGADIVFLPGQPAFLSGGGEGTQSFLRLGTAPWVVLPKSAAYISQPQAAPLYGGSQNKPLEFMGIPTLIIPDDAPPVPLLPYRLAKLTPSNAPQPAKTEEVLAAARNELLQEAAQGFTQFANSVQTAVTPQGLMVGVTADGAKLGEWAWIGLANTTERQAELPNMRFTDISPKMRYSYQTVELRRFYGSPNDITDSAGVSGDFDFGVDGWVFHTAPTEWRQDAQEAERTVMIVQLCTGKSISEWLGGEAVVKASIKLAYDENKKVKAAYADFEQAINDPLFQGVMMLNCPVSADRSCPTFPKALGAVLDTIDREKLFAHHLIVRRSQIGNENGRLTMKSSAVSALVDYKQESRATYTVDKPSPDYSFCTTQFRLAVAQRRITQIESVSELTINRLFCAECAKPEGSAGNSLVIEGRLQEGDVPTYCYALREPGLYNLKNSAVEQLKIETLTLVMAEKCRFTMGGRLYFKQYANADLFSYGYSEGNETGGGLRFDGLCIAGKTDLLEADYNELLLRPADSAPRAQSFVASFPAVPRRLVFSISGTLPQDLGYSSIETPLQQSKAETPWFGIEHEINLGGLGGLSDGGGLCLKLLAAWNAKDGGCYFGVMLPGADALKLQGIFQLGFSAISLERSGVGGTGYMLVLNQLALKVLGFTFPPGENKLCLLADEDTRKLGWYAAYKGD